ncbi:MAG: 30S ribosomal protein S16 [Crocinitomicaceae bacterium]|nr:30S ribosomal protein S16 [Crocinitomicaceae bacterium]|tara:strand:+ start:665 stop:1444 length:780 start_codon:yes stop_codon:yes gene_type:complete
MATKIRLQRHGKKRYAYYHIVVADARAKRDGRNIERLGFYNPNTNPATIDFDFDRALHWVKVGAQPTDTARAILSYKGVMHKNHLDKGVLKGAFSQEEADKRFEKWMNEKQGIIQTKTDKISKASADAAAKALAEEKAKSDAKIAATEAKIAEALAAEEAAKAEAEAEATASEEGAEATEEAAPAAEATEETPVAEVVEEPAAEEAPKAEAEEETKEEAPAVEASASAEATGDTQKEKETPVAEAKEETPAEEETKAAE